jgi:HK97 gp10 family phage protein
MAVSAILPNSSERVIRDLKRFGAVMEADRKKISAYAAIPLVQAMQVRAPVGSKVHKRYSNKKEVARYHPGNLRKSIRVLTKLKRSDMTWVGPQKDGNKGTFGRARFDPFYAGMVNKGTKNTRARPFFEPAIAAAAPQVSRRMEMGFEVVIKKFNRK